MLGTACPFQLICFSTYLAIWQCCPFPLQASAPERDKNGTAAVEAMALASSLVTGSGEAVHRLRFNSCSEDPLHPCPY